MRRSIFALFAALALPALALPGLAHAVDLDAATRAKIDAAVTAELKKGDSPSVSVAVVKDGQVAFVKAYGQAVMTPPVKATPATRYQVASVSKEFVAAAALILQQDGKLSLDDHVSKWFPQVTSADKITVRQLLSHTSGISDDWPQDYVMPSMLRATTPDETLNTWGRQPLDFQPGEDWQYSNTGYVVAGRIIEKASGQPLFDFLKARVLEPVGIADALDSSAMHLRAPDALGYERRALGPLRRAPESGFGWDFAAGQLCLTAEDVAKWDVSLLNRTLLKPESYAEELKPIALNNGKDSGYALGLFIGMEGDRPIVHHGGEGTGYLAENRLYPDDKLAIVVLANTFSGSPQTNIADRIAYMLLPQTGVDARMQALFEGLQQGRVDRAAFTDNFNAYLDAKTVADYRASLGPLGAPTQFRMMREGDRGGMKFRVYRIAAGSKILRLSVFLTKAGQVEQFLVYDAAP
jgi:CubicO group peptidase (beta-lactamase class C family)